METGTWKYSLLLLFATVIWGAAFVAQSVGMDYIGPFTFNCVRNFIGGMVLIPAIFLLDWIRRHGKDLKKEEILQLNWKRKENFAGGACCGVILFAASSLQQIGIQYTSVGKAGFITAMYIVLVPVIGIFLKKKTGITVWVSVCLAVIGLYLLCITEGLSVNTGDFYMMLCAAVFSVHILAVDYFSPKADGVRMACVQFFVCGICSFAAMLITEEPQWNQIVKTWLPLLYSGVMSSGIAYTLQIVAQRRINSTVASLIMSMESVMAVLAGWMILGQELSARETGGCALMFTAIIMAQIPYAQRKKFSDVVLDARES